MRKRIIRILLYLFGAGTVLVVGLLVYIRLLSHIEEPVPPVPAIANQEVEMLPSGLYTLGPNWFRRSETGLYELYVEGDPYERGLSIGKLTKELVRHQEEVFTSQIRRIVPNRFYLSLLKDFVGWFNRSLPESVPEEFQLEILGVSKSASPEFTGIGQPFERLLNYHAAHDIGHALQNMSLVGCTSFSTWGERSADGTLIIGRNFDFYVGDDFSRDKIIAFYQPTDGYDFMMVTFGGMTGVLSGMNAEGLTVTINAAKSDIPSRAATPVTIVAREILQYASNIQEAYDIAKKREMFVSESFMIGSAKDGKTAIIEKSHSAIDFYKSDSSAIICTNHFQGPILSQTQLNREHMRTSASPYRYARVAELLAGTRQNTVVNTAKILRNRYGLKDSDIGMGNEKLVNQLIAHHAIIFQPEKKLVWVSTAPWQLGKFVCYDLNRIFSAGPPLRNEEIYEKQYEIPADSFLLTSDYTDFVKFSRFRFPFDDRTDMQPDSLVKWNPESYLGYMLGGDFWWEQGEWNRASELYRTGLQKEIATWQERNHMELRLHACNEKLK
jgi:hypothetical protein